MVAQATKARDGWNWASKVCSLFGWIAHLGESNFREQKSWDAFFLKNLKSHEWEIKSPKMIQNDPKWSRINLHSFFKSFLGIDWIDLANPGEYLLWRTWEPQLDHSITIARWISGPLASQPSPWYLCSTAEQPWVKLLVARYLDSNEGFLWTTFTGEFLQELWKKHLILQTFKSNLRATSHQSGIRRVATTLASLCSLFYAALPTATVFSARCACCGSYELEMLRGHRLKDTAPSRRHAATTKGSVWWPQMACNLQHRIRPSSWYWTSKPGNNDFVEVLKRVGASQVHMSRSFTSPDL